VTRTVKPTALKRLRDTYRSSDVLIPHIQRHVLKHHVTYNVRPDAHSLKYMHPSDMASKAWCGRHDFYRMVDTPTEKTPQANPSFRMENMLAEGHTIHGKYQTWLWEMGVLWGMWKCLECGHQWGALSPDVCQFCGSARLSYMELPLRHERYMVEGHADAAVHKLHGWDGLVEVKSIGTGTLRFEAPRLYNQYQDGMSAEEVWFRINHPFGSHMRQAQLYLWMSWPRYEQIVFVYEFKPTQATKEFVVTYNKGLIAPILEVAKEVSQAVRSGTPPQRPLWADSPDAKVCTSCEYRRTCWELGDGPTTTESDTTTVRVRRVASAKRKRLLRRTA
jgi:CRISPR/Cas system-associated exonuclease Cas4 (RecB family)